MIEVKLEEDDGHPTNEFLIEDDEQANSDPEAVDTSEEGLPGGSISTSQSDSSGDDEGSLVDAGEEEGSVNESNHTGMSGEISGSATLERPEYTINERVLRQLRDHVFNQMPIRLLSFERRGSSLEIKLLERGDIFARLANTLLGKPEISSLSETSASSLESEINWLISQEAKYAILSHTWLHSTPGELTYGDWMSGGRFDIEADDDNNIDPGYQKLAKFCKVAWRDFNLAFGWMDTVCINKESSSELDESIRSMYNWYERAGVCIVYLANTENLSEMASDPWFTRGWTLQEFIAPGFLKFYNSTWKLFRNPSVNDKEYPGHPKMMAQIKKATTLFEGELFDIWSTPFSRRMQLAARREVTREEDTAYSLMGIFNVSIATAYGEGAKRAFFRLLQEILNSNAHGILDLFNWAGDDNSTISKILPASPKQYLHSASSLDMYDIQPRTPLTLTHLGIRIPVVLIPAISVDVTDDVAFKPVGAYGAIATVSSTSQGISDVYRLLDSRVSGANTYSVDEDHPEQHRCTFAVFNISDGAKGIFIPQRCIAIPIQCVEEVGKVTDLGHVERVQTDRAIVFEMLERNTGQMDVSAKDYMVPAYEGIDLAPEELPKHGMQLVFKYL
ncbi:hypothetical protein BDN70DRAFT_480614 [Pholiota conissans]|uniref:Heterokaryon incompatibility domain-containing protein n=1 Tax=Pholiota conissans TaxID=109636 RepID=A0A9P5Z600_9AGAR|nr:hypothetical protein BDN70DRAFT_480614 [Pholiota conissans]